MSEEKFKDALHKILLGLGDLKTLHVELANSVVARCDRIKKSGKLENAGKDEVRVLARIDQLRCILRQRCLEASAIPGVTLKERQHLKDVMDTLKRLKDIDLTFGGTS